MDAVFYTWIGSRNRASIPLFNLGCHLFGTYATIFPYFAMGYVISKAGAAEATSSLYLTPVAALFISWIWIGEVPTILSIIGGLVTLGGVSLTHYKKKDIPIRTEYQEKTRA